MLTIHAGSLAIGFISGFVFYIMVSIIAALIVAKNMENKTEKNDSLYQKKLREAGYESDVFE